MMEFCPIRYTDTTHIYNAMCDKKCAWYINGDCAVVSLHDVANEVSDGLNTLSKVLFDTIGSYKAGDALDAIVSMSEAVLELTGGDAR